MNNAPGVPIVETSSGVLRGGRRATPDGAVEEFLGVPFARHVGRFRLSEPLQTSEAVLDVENYGPGAPQDPSRVTNFTVDEAACLNVNVWRPATGAASPRPVLVWVHGGGHLYGSNTNVLCDGGRLAAFGDVVVVAGNYRLGALGYLRLEHLLGPEFADSQNLALLDLVDLLRWVSANASAFGGDPRNVTVMGQSAGAVMAAALLAIPDASGLFRRLIVESGTAERVSTLEQCERLTAELLAEAGCDDPSRLLDLPWPALVSAQERVIARRSVGRPNLDLAFRPALDGRTLSLSPVDAARAGASPDIDLIVGTNVNEASGFVDLRRGDLATRRSLERQAALLLPGLDGGAARHYRAALDADTGRSNTDAEALEACMADLVYRQPSQRLLDARRTAYGSLRAYLFAWERPDGEWIRRAGHSLELPFVFRHVDDSEAAVEEVGPRAPRALQEHVSSAWARFAHNAEPGGWRPYGDSRNTLLLDTASSEVSDPRSSIRELVAQSGN